MANEKENALTTIQWNFYNKEFCSPWTKNLLQRSHSNCKAWMKKMQQLIV